MNIIQTDINLPGPFKNKLAYTLDNVFTADECQQLIDLSEEQGYKPALYNDSYRPAQRNNYRCIIDSHEMANKIYDKIKSHIPKFCNDCECIGLNERLRFLRYEPKQYFKSHYDGFYQRSDRERSYITIQLYLNDGFDGGSTRFLDTSSNDFVDCFPKVGRILVFEHRILHQGMEISDGRKYAIRTDIMYRWK